MLLTRTYDDRMQRMQRRRQDFFLYPLAGRRGRVGRARHALRPSDMLFPGYRNQGLQVVRGIPLGDLMLSSWCPTPVTCAKAASCPSCTTHGQTIFFHLRQSGDAVSSGGGLGHGGGHQGRRQLAATWMGEGSSAEADFHHALLFRLGVSGAGDSQRGQ